MLLVFALATVLEVAARPQTAGGGESAKAAHRAGKATLLAEGERRRAVRDRGGRVRNVQTVGVSAMLS